MLSRYCCDLPMLTQVILPLETFPTDLAAKGQLRALVGALVYHQVVGLGESALAVLADELALGAQFTPKVPCVILVDLHHGEHFVWSMVLARLAGLGGLWYGTKNMLLHCYCNLLLYIINDKTENR